MCASSEASPGTNTDTQLREAIDTHLEGLIAGINHDRLRDAAEYSVLRGGKRVRPILALRTCLFLGGELEDGLPGACAFELIHAFSLVHDDLPALDDDDVRRGMPSVHKAFGESLAILTGDMLQSLALVAAAGSPRNAGRIVSEVAGATCAMIEGQTWDTEGGFPPDISTAGQLDLVHRNKTAALIRGACRSGAIAADADVESLGAIDRWGTALGFMFQVVDDILDETQSSDHLGKATGKDLEQGKLTSPGVHGLEGAHACVSRLEAEANCALSHFGERGAELGEITSSLAIRTH